MLSHDDLGIDLSNFRRHARAGAAMSIVGAAILVGTLSYSGFRLSRLEREVAKSSQNLEASVVEVAKLKREVAELEHKRKTLTDLFNENSLQGRVAAVVRVQKTNDPVNDLLFTVELDGPSEILDRIKRVKYNFSVSPRLPEFKESRDRDAKFAVQTQRIGCLDQVVIEVWTSPTSSDFLVTDLCKAMTLAPNSHRSTSDSASR